MDALEHLMEEHRRLEGMLERLADTEEGTDREQLLGALEQALSTHMAVEETFIYPLIAATKDDERFERASAEHDHTRQGLARLRGFATEPGFGVAVGMVADGVVHHVQEEETELFPLLRERASDRIDAIDPEKLERGAKASSSLTFDEHRRDVE